MSTAVDPAFDPDHYNLAQTRYFEDFELGERFPSPPRHGWRSAVSGVSDRIWRQPSDSLRPRVLPRPGPSRPAGAWVPGVGADCAWGRHVAAPSGRFAGGIHRAVLQVPGASLRGLILCTPMLEIVELRPQRTTGVMVLRNTVHNEKGELVLEGSQSLLVRKRKPAEG